MRSRRGDAGANEIDAVTRRARRTRALVIVCLTFHSDVTAGVSNTGVGAIHGLTTPCVVAETLRIELHDDSGGRAVHRRGSLTAQRTRTELHRGNSLRPHVEYARTMTLLLRSTPSYERRARTLCRGDGDTATLRSENSDQRLRFGSRSRSRNGVTRAYEVRSLPMSRALLRRQPPAR